MDERNSYQHCSAIAFLIKSLQKVRAFLQLRRQWFPASRLLEEFVQRLTRRRRMAMSELWFWDLLV
jgi:hypothetical protein